MVNDVEEFFKILNQSGLGLTETNYNVRAFILGSKKPQAPTFFLVGGVHGLERIGAQLCFSYLKHLVDRLLWDQVLQDMLLNIRLVFIPLLNPVGYARITRSNGNGVDLMRNSPIESEEKVPFLLGGQRISHRLPWFRGQEGQIEDENKFLIEVFEKHCSKSQCLVAIDFHSGFGLRDQLWFPHAYTKRPFADLAYWHSLMSLFDKTYPYHIYKVQPQSQVYHLHGDLWDYLYLKFKQKNSAVFIPLTLEMGSWNWVKKNPIQLISRDGLFNPIKDHRKRRTFRRHHLLLDFITRALVSNQIWAHLDEVQRMKHNSLARERWYEI